MSNIPLKMAGFLNIWALDLLQVHCFDLIAVYCSFLAATPWHMLASHLGASLVTPEPCWQDRTWLHTQRSVYSPVCFEQFVLFLCCLWRLLPSGTITRDIYDLSGLGASTVHLLLFFFFLKCIHTVVEIAVVLCSSCVGFWLSCGKNEFWCSQRMSVTVKLKSVRNVSTTSNHNVIPTLTMWLCCLNTTATVSQYKPHVSAYNHVHAKCVTCRH